MSTPRPPFDYEKKDPGSAYKYAHYEAESPCPELEQVIATSAHWAYKYASCVLYGRFVAAEPLIAADPHWAYCYATYVIRGRWPEGEAAIAKNQESVLKYIQLILKKRFPLAEPMLRDDDHLWRSYKKILQQVDPEGYDELMLTTGDWVPDTVAEAALDAARRSN